MDGQIESSFERLFLVMIVIVYEHSMTMNVTSSRYEKIHNCD